MVEDIAVGNLDGIKPAVKKRYAREKYLIPITVEDRLEYFESA